MVVRVNGIWNLLHFISKRLRTIQTQNHRLNWNLNLIFLLLSISSSFIGPNANIHPSVKHTHAHTHTLNPFILVERIDENTEFVYAHSRRSTIVFWTILYVFDTTWCPTPLIQSHKSCRTGWGRKSVNEKSASWAMVVKYDANVTTRTLTFDMPGLMSSFRSRGASVVSACGMMCVRSTSVACWKCKKKNKQNQSFPTSSIPFLSATHIGQWLQFVEFKTDNIVIVGEITRCGRCTEIIAGRQ